MPRQARGERALALWRDAPVPGRSLRGLPDADLLTVIVTGDLDAARLGCLAHRDGQGEKGHRAGDECADRDARDWDAHWRAAARELTGTVVGKAKKNYAVDSVLAIDVSRLGCAGPWPANPSWTAIFGRVFDDRDWALSGHHPVPFAAV